MSTTDTAKQIRSDLKSQLGLNSRQVSVKKTPGGAVRVKILVPTVSIDAVKKIACRYERVSHCEATGEILSGGNTFVFVLYAEEVIKHVAAVVRAMYEGAGSFRGISMYRSGTGDDDLDWFSAHGPGVSVRCWGLDFMCRQVAERLLSGAGACVKHTDCAEHEAIGIACAEASRAAA